ncbi:hypothetical protein, partial [Comamonas endophytica]|uniref:hypothetical protein n=1 Tax=Comamonas endophytica TaxID=2949090 RepID=UPI001E3A1D97
LRISGKISFLAWLAVISEALNYATVLKTLSTLSFSPQIQSRDRFSSEALHCSPVFQPFSKQGPNFEMAS